MTNEPKTVGDLLVEAVNSGDLAVMQKAMAQVWKSTAKVGLPTPTEQDIDKIVNEQPPRDSHDK